MLYSTVLSSRFRKELNLTIHLNVGAAFAFQIGRKVRCIDALVCLRVKAVIAQDEIASPSNQNVRETGREGFAPVSRSWKKATEVRGVNGEVGLVGGMKQFDLVENVPCSPIAWSSSRVSSSDDWDRLPYNPKQAYNAVSPRFASYGFRRLVESLDQHRCRCPAESSRHPHPLSMQPIDTTWALSS